MIRPSYCPSWNDCARRTAAALFRAQIEESGIELRRPSASVGALVGSGVHAAAAFTLRGKMDTGRLGAETEAVDRGVAEFESRLNDEGVVYDDVTDSVSTAQRQIRRMVLAYRRHVPADIVPVAVEERLEADLGDGFFLSGQVDNAVARAHDERLNDLKTGKIQRANLTQYGCYSLLYRSHGHRIVGLAEDFLRRVRVGSEQPPVQTVQILMSIAENEAQATIADMKRSFEDFAARKVSGRAPELAFRANPQSMLCSDRYCPAWGTEFCRAHKGAET